MKTVIGGCPLGSECEAPGKDADGKDIIVRCPWYTMVRGTQPNTGKDTDEWGCAIAWMPALLINSANESRKTSAAVESFRNKMVDGISEMMLKTPQITPPPKEKTINEH